MFDHFIKQQLDSRQQAGLLRTRNVLDGYQGQTFVLNGKPYINFSSNDYLGIAADSKVTNAADAGATASPLVVGRHKLHQELEELILDWVGAPNHYGCLLFPSGFAANTGVISALFNQKDSDAFLIQDKLNHASLMDAGKNVQGLGHARQLRFAHNDIEDCAKILAKRSNPDNKTLTVTEGVFSMDGDSPDLAKLQQTVKQHNSWWMLDDAHGIGVLGKEGAGSLNSQSVSVGGIDLVVITFGKAIGSQGAAVIASQNTIDYLTNFCREYIYSTHLSPLQAQATINNIKLIRKDNWRRDKLNDNILLFRESMKNSRFSLLNSQSPIQPVLVGDEQAAVELSEQLKLHGYWAGAMRYPTVAKGKSRLRVTITSQHSDKNIANLTEILSQTDISNRAGVK